MSFIINPYSYAVAGGGGPQPTDLSDLQLWLPASSASAVGNGNQISTWPDMSGNGRDATGVTGAGADLPRYYSTLGPNSKPTVRLTPDGAHSNWFSLPDFLTAYTSGEAFVVVKIDADPPPNDATHPDGPPLGDWGNSGNPSIYVFPSDSHLYDDFGSSSRKDCGDPSASLTAWTVYNPRTASGAWSMNLSNVSQFSTGTNTVSWGTAPLIGRASARNSVMNAYISDIIFYNRVLDDATERKPVIYAYLNNTYGFSLPTS